MRGGGIVQAENELKGTKEVFSAAVLSTFLLCRACMTLFICCVFIAISSVHRADALDACKFVIDEIKAPVPIWEKEVYANGEVWKENSEFLERGSKLGSAGLQ
ncbi:unnamed protein product, partial [Vitis vinifera]